MPVAPTGKSKSPCIGERRAKPIKISMYRRALSEAYKGLNPAGRYDIMIDGKESAVLEQSRFSHKAIKEIFQRQAHGLVFPAEKDICHVCF